MYIVGKDTDIVVITNESEAIEIRYKKVDGGFLGNEDLKDYYIISNSRSGAEYLLGDFDSVEEATKVFKDILKCFVNGDIMYDLSKREVINVSTNI